LEGHLSISARQRSLADDFQSRHCSMRSACLKGATNGLMHRSKRNLCSITSSARCLRDRGTSRSSAFAVLRLMTSSYVVITVQCPGHFLEGEIAPIVSTEIMPGTCP
jgi:hypothetical protein